MTEEQQAAIAALREVENKLAVTRNTLGSTRGNAGGWKNEAQYQELSRRLYLARLACNYTLTPRDKLNGSYYIVDRGFDSLQS